MSHIKSSDLKSLGSKVGSLFFAYCSTILGSAQSPPVPPAGIVDRQIEQEYEVKEVEPQKQIPLLEFDLPKEELDVGEEKVTIRSVEVSGNSVNSISRAASNFKVVFEPRAFNERAQGNVSSHPK